MFSFDIDEKTRATNNTYVFDEGGLIAGANGVSLGERNLGRRGKKLYLAFVVAQDHGQYVTDCVVWPFVQYVT